jgi:signal transduction histidine kinase
MVKMKFEYKITIAYLFIGALWVSFSDRLVQELVIDPDYLTKVQTYKGWFYVFMTGILFYFLLEKHLVKIRDAEKQAKESDLLKTAFLQNMSHEIRTPMNGIMGFADLLKTKDLSQEKKEMYIDIITKSSDQLLAVVNDVLDISLIETGNVMVQNSEFHLNELLDQFYTSRITFLKKEITLHIDNSLADQDLVLHADRIKLHQVLNNLISNAIKYTNKGFVKYGCEMHEDCLLFFVKDSGIGILEEDQNKIFDRFYRTDVEETKSIGGVGLGLSICKGNVKLLGGDIWVESIHGNGSQFYFTIPASLIKQKEIAHENDN